MARLLTLELTQVLAEFRVITKFEAKKNGTWESNLYFTEPLPPTGLTPTVSNSPVSL